MRFYGVYECCILFKVVFFVLIMPLNCELGDTVVGSGVDIGGIVLTLFGPPGAGKGTLSNQLRHMGFNVLSPGNMLRCKADTQVEGGLTIKELIQAGKFVPDEVVDDIVLPNIVEIAANNKGGVVVDGYPRTLRQVEKFVDYLEKHGLNKHVIVFVLRVKREELCDRLSNRLVCSNLACQKVYSKHFVSEFICKDCGSSLIVRVDDNPEAVAERLKSYELFEKDALQLVRQRGYSVVIHDGSYSSPEEVGSYFEAQLKNILETTR